MSYAPSLSLIVEVGAKGATKTTPTLTNSLHISTNMTGNLRVSVTSKVKQEAFTVRGLADNVVEVNQCNPVL